VYKWYTGTTYISRLEVSISTQYEDMKDDTKCLKWVGLG